MTQILNEMMASMLGDESVAVEFVFAGELAAIDSALVAVTPVNGADPAAASMLVGSPQITGSSVFQRVQPGVPGLNYQLVCRAVRGDDSRIRHALLPVRGV